MWVVQKIRHFSFQEAFFFETPEKPNSVLELLRTHGLTQTHIEKIIASRPGLLLADLEAKLRPNLNLLESLGISETSLGKLLCKEPRFLDSDLLQTVEFFRAQRFSDEQISVMINKRPRLFTFNVNTNFKPKLEFFRSLGLTDVDVARIFSCAPSILDRSLKNRIIPNIEVLRQVLGTNLNALKASMIDYDLEKTLVPNISTLKSHGVPETFISRIFMTQPRSLLLSPCRFDEAVSEVVTLDFDPNQMLFLLAVHAMTTVSKTLWERKLELYGSFGLSRNQVYSAFKVQPLCMLISEKKITRSMDFYTHKLNIEPSIISRQPSILLYSLEKRIIPRSSILQLLMSKGLIKKKFTIISLFAYLRMTENLFMEKWVKKYERVLPDVVKVYKGEIEFRRLPIILAA